MTFEYKLRFALPCHVLRRKYMPYGHGTHPAILAMPLAQTPQFNHRMWFAMPRHDLSITEHVLWLRHTLCARKVHLSIAVRDSRRRLPKTSFSLLLVGYVLRGRGTSYDCSMCIWRTYCFGVLVLTCKHAYVNVRLHPSSSLCFCTCALSRIACACLYEACQHNPKVMSKGSGPRSWSIGESSARGAREDSSVDIKRERANKQNIVLL